MTKTTSVVAEQLLPVCIYYIISNPTSNVHFTQHSLTKRNWQLTKINYEIKLINAVRLKYRIGCYNSSYGTWTQPNPYKFWTSCGARHNKPRPLLRRSERPKNSNFITFSVARWQHRTARGPQSNQIAVAGDNKQLGLLPADPFTRIDPKLNQVVPRSLHTFPKNFMEIGPAVFSQSCWQRNKQRNRSKTIPRPPSGAG